MSDTDYDRLAPLYAALLDPLLAGLRGRVARTLAHTMTSTAGSVVDLCCGTGPQAGALAEAGMATTGVDISGGMLDQARRRFPDIAFIEVDAADTRLEGASFDAACVSLALHEMQEPLRLALLAEAARLVRPGGTICVADYRLPSGPRRLVSPVVGVVERLAGREHYRAYRDFLDRGATPALLARAGFMARQQTTALMGMVGVFTAPLRTDHEGKT